LAPPIATLLAYPGLEKIGSDDSSNLLFLGICLSQAAAVEIITRGIESIEKDGESAVD
jgi:hypothetical protein